MDEQTIRLECLKLAFQLARERADFEVDQMIDNALAMAYAVAFGIVRLEPTK